MRSSVIIISYKVYTNHLPVDVHRDDIIIIVSRVKKKKEKRFVVRRSNVVFTPRYASTYRWKSENLFRIVYLFRGGFAITYVSYLGEKTRVFHVTRTLFSLHSSTTYERATPAPLAYSDRYCIGYFRRVVLNGEITCMTEIHGHRANNPGTII